MECISCGRELTTGDSGPICKICEDKAPNLDKPLMYGWICPRCQTVHSPFTSECTCMPPMV
jgi:hypothetical protein